jgi:hypothetical protein
MALSFKGVLPPPSVPWVDTQGRPTQAFAQYITQTDALARLLAGGNIGTLISAANDAAAAQAGVAIGSYYRNGSVVQVRVV